MKHLLLSAVVLGSMTLAGCNSMAYDDERTMIIDGEQQVVKVVNKSSVAIEIDPRPVVCDLPATDGTMIKGECMQYRQPFQKNFSVLKGGIQGFTFEPGYRYMLDVRQEAKPNPETGVVEAVWILNDVISKTSETL